MMSADVQRSIGRIEGNIEVYHKSTDEKLDNIIKLIETNTANHAQLEKRVSNLETDKKIVTRISGAVSGTISIITTAIIHVGIRIITR